MKEHVYESYFDKKRIFNQKYDQNSYSMIREENGKVPGKKVKKIKKITKRFNDKLTGKEVVTVKTIITYIDGEEVVDNYVL